MKRTCKIKKTKKLLFLLLTLNEVLQHIQETTTVAKQQNTLQK